MQIDEAVLCAKKREIPGYPTIMNRKAFILENTRLVSPAICPEVRLHLITDSCPLWHATEQELATLGIGDPYWGFCWAGGQALARYILDHPDVVAGKRVFIFGAGCGIEAVVAGLSGAGFILGSDTDPMAAEAARLNGPANGVTVETTTEDLIGAPLDGFDVVLAGDMFYDPAFSRKVLAWFGALAADGLKVFLSDPCRGNLSDFPLKPLATYKAPSDVDIFGKYLMDTVVYTF
jgi:predicted nicotinamide N-methyase